MNNENKQYFLKCFCIVLFSCLVMSYPKISIAEKKEQNFLDKMIKTSETFLDSSLKSLDIFVKDMGKLVDEQIIDFEKTIKDNKKVDIRDKIDSIRLYVENINQLKKEEENASKLTLFSHSKKDYRIKIDEVLAGLEGTLFDGEIVNYSERIRVTRLNIKRLEKKKAKLNEDFIFAPKNKKIFESNKDEIKVKIKNIDEIIGKSKHLISELEFDLKRKMDALGISLTREQIRVMTTRVDGDDLAKTLAIFDITKQVSNTLGRLMKQNAFSPESTVQYFGTYVILGEILGYSQRTYISKIDKVYLPAIERIEGDIEKSIEFTNDAIKRSTSEDNEIVLQGNIKSNKFSLKVLEHYKNILEDQKQSLTDALKNTQEQITVAYSTYDTAANSANLLNIINQTQNAFDKIMNLQMPKITPFSNISLERKFEELSDKMLLNTETK